MGLKWTFERISKLGRSSYHGIPADGGVRMMCERLAVKVTKGIPLLENDIRYLERLEKVRNEEMKKGKSKKVRMVPGTDVPYENWIQAWGITEQMKRKKIDWVNVFVWFGFIPIFSFLSWYGIYKLVMWILYG